MQRSLALALMAFLAGCAPRAGRNVVRHPNGEVRWMVQTLDGRPHGRSEVRDEQGRLVSRGSFRDGVRHGIFEFFDASGQVVRRTVFVEGEEVWSGSGSVPAEYADVPVDPPEREPPEATSEFVAADRVSRRDRALAQLGLHALAGEAAPSSAQRLELFAQHTFPWAIGYVDVTTVAASGDMAMGGGLGKLVVETGAARSWRLSAPGGRASLDGLVRLGAFAPIAGDDRDGYVAAAATSYERLTDAVTAFPRAAGLRTSASLLGQSGIAHYRVDAGLDTAFALPGESDVASLRRAQLVGRINLGGGFVTRHLSGTVELVSVAALNEPTAERRLANALSLGVRLRTWSVRPFGGLAAPLDGGLIGDSFAVLIGVEYLEDR